MATKKQIPAKAGKAAVKPAVKKVAKVAKPLPKKTVQPTKVVPAKKAVAKKAVVKPATKKLIAPAPKKVVAKPVAKKTAKPAPKPVKVLAKATPKKVISVIKVVKSKAKPVIKKAVIAKHEPKKVINPAPKSMAKKEITKTTAAKTVVEKAVPVKPAAEVKAKDIKVPAPKPVVIPKITTKTVRKYQPEFTKSVLDKTQRDPGAPSQRYSDAELQEFRELIQRKLEAAKKELSYLHGLITRKDEMGGDEGDNRYMTMEDGSLSMEREQLSQMASRQITFIDHLEKAVMRIENKTYGICRVTGKLIDKARLRAVPHATLSIEAKMGNAK
jgi:RNA polymerase-binding transcription factor DksA